MQKGVNGLRIKAGRGRRTRLTVDQRHELKAALSKSPQDFGYDAAIWSGFLTGEHIQKTYQIEYKPSAIYSLMRRIEFSFNQESKSAECTIHRMCNYII